MRKLSVGRGSTNGSSMGRRANLDHHGMDTTPGSSSISGSTLSLPRTVVPKAQQRDEPKKWSTNHPHKKGAWVLPVEYWCSTIGRWTDAAHLSVNKNRTKLYLDVLFPNSVESHNQTSRERRIKFLLDTSLRVEHSQPLSVDFHLVLSGGGEVVRHRVAVFTEDEGVAVVKLLEGRGAQVIRRRTVLPKPASSPVLQQQQQLKKKPLRPISEGEQLIAITSSFGASVTSIASHIDTSIPQPPHEKGTNMTQNHKVLRRKSTGSYDSYHQNNPQTTGQYHNRTSMIKSARPFRRNSMTSRSKGGYDKTTWYYGHYDKKDDDDEYYNDEEIMRYDAKRTTKNSRQSLETDEEESSEEEEEEGSFSDINSSRTPYNLSTHHDETDGAKLLSSVRGKLPSFFHSSPSLNASRVSRASSNQSKPIQRVPTNERLEKYKFMLVGIEPDDSLDPGTFGLDPEDGMSYIGLEFTDYPSEIFCPSPLTVETEVASQLERRSWIRKSFEELHLDTTKTLGLKRSHSMVYQSTGNVALVVDDTVTSGGEISAKISAQPTGKLSYVDEDTTSTRASTRDETDHTYNRDKMLTSKTAVDFDLPFAARGTACDKVLRILSNGSPTNIESL